MKKIILLFIAFAPLFGLAQDVIVLQNGDLIKSKVIEVGISEIKYSRFEQEDGPTYSVSRSEIFAIHYADGTKDFLTETDRVSGKVNEAIENIARDTSQVFSRYDEFMKRKIVIHAGVGFGKLYSAVNEIGVDSYEAQSVNWGFDFGLGLNTNLMVGFAFNRGSYTANRSFSDEFAFTKTTYDISQTTSSFAFWGRYYIKTKYPQLRPYATVGLSLNTSHVTVLMNIDTDSQTIDFERGGNIKDIFPVTRVGVELLLWNNMGFFAEAGYGNTMVNLGAIIQL